MPPGFRWIGTEVLIEPTGHAELCKNLFHKLNRTGTWLAKWNTCLFSKAKRHLHSALLVILWLDIAQESRILSLDEHDLRARLKRKVISIANVKEADANTNFFSPTNQYWKKQKPYTMVGSRTTKLKEDIIHT